jgi:hypothetical protein
MECDICGHKWVQVGPIYVQEYDCSKCGYKQAIPPFGDDL